MRHHVAAVLTTLVLSAFIVGGTALSASAATLTQTGPGPVNGTVVEAPISHSVIVVISRSVLEPLIGLFNGVSLLPAGFGF